MLERVPVIDAIAATRASCWPFVFGGDADAAKYCVLRYGVLLLCIS